MALGPNRRIVQTWRSSEFPDDAPDSQIEVLLEDAEGGAATMITLRHTEIPDGQGESYKQGWDESYFTPMNEYFSGVES